jgi:hypothetical protein
MENLNHQRSSRLTNPILYQETKNQQQQQNLNRITFNTAALSNNFPAEVGL